MFFDQKNTIYGSLGIIEAVSSFPLCLFGGDQMMPRGIIRNSLGDASRHHQGVKWSFMGWFYKGHWSLDWWFEPTPGHVSSLISPHCPHAYLTQLSLHFIYKVGTTSCITDWNKVITCSNFTSNMHCGMWSMIIPIKGPWASIGPLSFCFTEVMHNEIWKFLSSILSFLTFEKLHAEIFGQHFNTTNQ